MIYIERKRKEEGIEQMYCTNKEKEAGKDTIGREDEKHVIHSAVYVWCTTEPDTQSVS